MTNPRPATDWAPVSQALSEARSRSAPRDPAALELMHEAMAGYAAWMKKSHATHPVAARFGILSEIVVSRAAPTTAITVASRPAFVAKAGRSSTYENDA